MSDAPNKPPALHVVSLESRRAGEMASLLTRRGIAVTSAPSMREVPLGDQTDAMAFGETLLAGELDVLVLLTGVGARMLVDAIATQVPRERVLAAVAAVPVACRGPKPAALLKEWGIVPSVVAPAPNTYLELLSALDAQLPVAGKRVVVQEYGQRNEALLGALAERGAEVRAVPIYGWQMPDDVSALRDAVHMLVDGRANVLSLTSQQQVHNLMQVARDLGLADALTGALRGRVVLASIGPVTNGALHAYGLREDLEPTLGKMGHLAKLIAERAQSCLASKSA